MNIGVIGGSGYAGGELLRLLAQHPEFSVRVVTAHTHAGELITTIHPQLQSYAGQRFLPTDPSLLDSCDLLFLALPHGESGSLVKQLRQEIKIVDLGADFRLHNSQSWSTYYGGAHAGTWTYGLPELFRSQIQGSQIIANPGCYATAITLGAYPAAALADLSDLVVVAASGTTGAGRTAKINLLASEVMGSMSSYKFGGVHQHTPEIEETLQRATGTAAKVSFTPILAPQPRGILATLSMKTTASEEEIRGAYQEKYAEERFIHLLPAGQMPKTSSVYGSNHVHLQVAVDSHTSRLTISVAIDNLGKGAAGQALSLIHI